MGLSEEEEIRLASLPVSIGSTRRIIIGYQDGDESNSLSLSPTEAHSLATRLIAAADEAESVPRFTEEDVGAILHILLERKITNGGFHDHEGFFRDLRALRKPGSES